MPHRRRPAEPGRAVDARAVGQRRTPCRYQRYDILCVVLLLGVVTVHAEDHPGRPLYLRYCAACHGRQGRGDGPVAPALGEKPTDLTQLAAHGEEFPLQAVVDAIDGTRTVRAHGVSEMPVWGEVFEPSSASREQKLVARSKIVAIADYLRSLQGARPPSH